MKSISLEKEQPAFNKANKTLKRNNNFSGGKKNQDVNKRRKKRSFKLPNNRGIIYIGHIPHGFYEDQMREYFSQFGIVTTAVVARSKKTGRSRGFGFVEFKDQEVAKIAAETMNNYLMYNRILKCRYIPSEEKKGKLYPSRISESNYPRQKNRIATLKNNMEAFSKLNQETYLKKVQKKVNEFKKFFESKGIDFTFNISDKNLESEEAQNSNNSKKPESESDTDSQVGVLEIDESDSDLSFKTPPQVKKVIKKSSNHSATALKKNVLSKKIQAKKEAKVNELKSKKSSKIQGKDKLSKKSEVSLNNSKKKLEKKEVKLAKPVKKPEMTLTKKDINAKIKQKNLKRSSELKERKKVGRNQGTLICDNKVKKVSRKIKANAKK